MAEVRPPLNWPKLLLASASPRRAALLRQVGADFKVRAVSVDESWPPGAAPARTAVDIAERKARAAWRQYRRLFPDRVVLAADTVVVLGRRLLGKPDNESQAREMLRLLSGRTHRVITGLCLLSADGRAAKGYQATAVRFRRLSGPTIDWYLSTGEPFDNAGAYGIQGRGALLVEGIEGCYFNVVGLPLGRLHGLLCRLRS